MSFASLGLSEALAGAVEAAGYAQPTPVQQRESLFVEKDPVAWASSKVDPVSGATLSALRAGRLTGAAKSWLRSSNFSAAVLGGVGATGANGAFATAAAAGVGLGGAGTSTTICRVVNALVSSGWRLSVLSQVGLPDSNHKCAKSTASTSNAAWL